MPRFGSIVGALSIAAGLSGCGVCPEPDRLTVVSALQYHPRSIVGPDGKLTQVQMVPFDAWADNPRVAAFLHKVLEQEGKSALVSSYGFQCQALPTPDCPDCSSCRRTMPRVRDNLYSIVGCINDGVMQFQVNVGPGSDVRAMTYWRR